MFYTNTIYKCNEFCSQVGFNLMKYLYTLISIIPCIQHYILNSYLISDKVLILILSFLGAWRYISYTLLYSNNCMISAALKHNHASVIYVMYADAA